jgi:uncharacterized protein YebE (UPF0316 family)
METFDWQTWVILPLFVFFARMIDVAIGTLRIIFTSRGRRKLAPLLGFVEVFIWITVIAQITRGTHNTLAYLAYAGGFAAGNYLGMIIEDKLAIGTLVIRAFLPEKGDELVNLLLEQGYGVTHVHGHGASGPVMLVYTVVMRRELPHVIDIIQSVHPKTFFTVEELRSARQGIFPVRASGFSRKKK